ITGELVRALKDRPGYPEQPRLVVLADPCGCSWLAASDDDWLIPFGIMGAPVSGLISRSVWSSEGLHGCMVCEHLSEFECSRMLVDTVAHFRKKLTPSSLAPLSWNTESARILWQTSRDVIAFLADEFKVDSVNRIKPGIAEATRAVLRRVPDHVFVRSIDDPDVALLVGLAREKGIVVTEMGGTLGQYRAVTIIKKVL
ncbi:cysteine protease StiP domain-containing protein, partial [Escherichia coli]